MVRQGYKQTEVGIIPEDWKVSTMESITSLMTNGFVGTIKSEYVPSGTGVLYLQGFNIKENGFDLTGVTYVSDEFHKKHLKLQIKKEKHTRQDLNALFFLMCHDTPYSL